MSNKNWFVAGSWYTTAQVRGAGRLCGWIIESHRILSSTGEVIGKRYAKFDRSWKPPV